MNLVKPNDL
ncbi:hypothetical protein Zm00014a_030599 [Zea mays]|uniref:Uncharacterized protein n=1 Tax=Zea mays TaxID=4577 RepID=A0A3L6EQF1_MAIZE|nr:hypothetical protein Zm00014a_030599 [Zea mays]